MKLHSTRYNPIVTRLIGEAIMDMPDGVFTSDKRMEQIRRVLRELANAAYLAGQATPTEPLSRETTEER